MNQLRRIIIRSCWFLSSPSIIELLWYLFARFLDTDPPVSRRWCVGQSHTHSLSEGKQVEVIRVAWFMSGITLSMMLGIVVFAFHSHE